MVKIEMSGERFPAIDEANLDLYRALWVSVALQDFVDARSNSKKRCGDCCSCDQASSLFAGIH